MSLRQRVTNAFQAFTSDRTDNSLNTAAEFLRFGNKNQQPLYQDWSQVEMSDKDMYTGYSYAAIEKRANRAAILGKNFLFTKASQPIMDAAKLKETKVEHPYLSLIASSKDFTEKKFWHDISTYMDLEGIYYLMAVRAVGNPKADGSPTVGAVQKFVMLNPYQVTRVVRESDGTVGGYVEARNGLYREIPKEMIIEIRKLNPFNNDEPFSMTDAAKENQFTMKQAGDYTRHSIKGNINAPGAITTEVVLEDQIFNNFVARIKNHDKGEPIYGNGAGAINWSSMQVDLDNAALDKINEIHRSTLFAVSGTSKTIMGIEESGTGREVSKTQKDDFTENAVMPQIEDIIDALNLDYRRYYPEWDSNQYEIALDNPLESDRDAELKDIEIRQTEHDMVVALVNLGYEFDLAAKYAHGDITLMELGEPTLEPQLTPQQLQVQAAQAAGLPAPSATPGEDPGSNQPDQTGTDPNTPAGTGNTISIKTTNGKTGNTREVNMLTAVKFVKPEENEKALKAAIKEAEKEKKRLDKEAKDAEKLAKDDEKKKKKSKTTDLPDETKPNEGDVVEPPVEKPPLVTVEVKTPNNLEDRLKAVNQIAARDYPSLYDGMDIDMDDLGCIMIDTEKIPVLQYIKDPQADLYYDTNYDQSPVPGENEAHVTLLFGLLENGNIWKDKVDMLLMGWGIDSVTINEVSYFDLGDSYAVIGLVDLSPELLDGHERLTLLPHINTFSEYHPHITLAYINHDPELLDKWVTPLNKKYAGQKVAVTGLNYGDLPDPDDTDDTDPDSDGDDDSDLTTDTDDDYRYPAYNREAKQAILSPVEAPKNHVHHEHDNDINPTLEKAKNALEPDTRDKVILNESNLYTAVANLEKDVAQAIIQKFNDGQYKEANDLLSEAEQKRFENQLAVTIAGFYSVLYPIYAGQLMQERANRFEQQGVFSMTNEVEDFIKQASTKAADSHINTILGDLGDAVTTAHDAQTQQELVGLVQVKAQEQDTTVLSKLPDNPNIEDIKKAVKKGKFDNSELYAKAQELAKQGAGLDAITAAIRNEYADISKGRAKTIARHETNRVFNMAQYQADEQFLTESGMMSNAYKVLYSRNGNPCPICEMLIKQTNANPIPFQKNFADLGDILSTPYKKTNGKMGVLTVPVNYEPIAAGNVHVNCGCEYRLLVKNSDGSFMNNIDARVANGPDFLAVDNYNHSHDDKGRFSSGGGGSISPEGGAYPGRKKGESFTAYADRYIKENPEIAKQKYQDRVKREFNTKSPNIVSADDAKFIVPGFTPERSADYHEPASAFVKNYYKTLLANPTSTHLPVVFTAGGTGAGKSTALRGHLKGSEHYTAVYDGNMAGYDSAKGKIDAALKTGRKVEIAYVDRNPVTAFKYGVIPRIKAEGRAITIKDHIQTHLDSRKVVSQIAEHYKGNKNVKVSVIDNNGALGTAHEVPLANLSESNYNKESLRSTLNDAAKEARDAGQISDGVYRLIRDNSATTVGNELDAGQSSRNTAEQGNDSTRERTDGDNTGQRVGGIDSEGNAIPIFLAENYNKSHDHLGRFASGSGGSGSVSLSHHSTVEQINEVASKLNVKNPQDAVAKVFNKLGYNGLPQLVSGTPQGKMLMRWEAGKSKDESAKFRNDMMNSQSRHLAEFGIFGAGNYFGTNLKAIHVYKNKNSVMTRAGLAPDTKVIPFKELSNVRSEMLRHDGLTKPAHDMIVDNGALASLLGYDAISTSGGYYAVMNRTKLVFGDQA